jgi:outer membrane biosynthesis protein TonB
MVERNEIRVIASQAIENADSSQDRLRAAQVIALIDIADALEEQNRLATPSPDPVLGSSKPKTPPKNSSKTKSAPVEDVPPVATEPDTPKYTGINQAKAG